MNGAICVTKIGSKVHKKHLMHVLKFLSNFYKQVRTQFFKGVKDRGKDNKLL